MSSKKVKMGDGIQKADNYIILDLRKIVGNSYQSRGHGVIPNLNAAGYGLFSQDEPGVDKKQAADKQPIWSMLTSDKPEVWPVVVGLIDEHEPEIKELADSIAGSTQLHNIGVVPVDGDPAKGFEVVYGMRRSLSRAYNYCRSAGVLPLNIKAEIAQDMADPHDLHLRAMQENRGRKNESLIDEAKRIQFLKKQGLKIPEIAERMGENQQNVRNRLQLLRLTPEEQQRVHTGRLGMVNALKVLKQREDGSAPPDATANDKPTSRKRTLTLKQTETLYSAVEKPDVDFCDDELWAICKTADVRKLFAKLLNVEYSTHGDMVKQKKEAEKARLAAEEAAKQEEEEGAAEETAAAK